MNFFAIIVLITALSSQAYAVVVNIAAEIDNNGTRTNRWTEQNLSEITLFTSTNQPFSAVGAEFDGAFFVSGQETDPGRYDTVFELDGDKNQTSISGYNRETPNNSDFNGTKGGGGNGEFIRKSDLVTTADGQFYVISFNADQKGDDLISLDEFRIYSRADSDGDTNTFNDPSPLPDTVADLDNLGNLRYSLDTPTEDNTIVILDSDNKMDMLVYLPVSTLANDADDAIIYLYSELGSYDPAGSNFEFGLSGKAEEWGIPSRPQDIPDISPIPEPEMLSFIGLTIFFVSCAYRCRVNP